MARRIERLRDARAALSDDRRLGQIADEVLRRHSEATGAQAGVVVLLTDGLLEVVASFGYDDDFLEPWQTFAMDVASPLTDSVRAGTTVIIPTVEELLERYPDLAPYGTEPHALAAFPLVAGGEVLGAVGLRFDVTGDPAAEVVRAGKAVSDVAAEALIQRRSRDMLATQVQQLQRALDSRIVIEQAKGVLVERHNVTPADAFERLRVAARNASVRIHDLARDVVDGVADA